MQFPTAGYLIYCLTHNTEPIINSWSKLKLTKKDKKNMYQVLGMT